MTVEIEKIYTFVMILTSCVIIFTCIYRQCLERAMLFKLKRTVSHGVTMSEVSGSIPDRVNAEIKFSLKSSGLGACCAVVVSMFHNTNILVTLRSGPRL